MVRKIIIGLSLLALSIKIDGQSRWVHQYHEELNAPGYYIDISYDYGYIVTGWVNPNYPHYTWIIKTDINGDKLWEKFVGSYDHSVVVECFKQGSNGEIILCGGIIQYGNTDPLIVKINECGEKEWCRIISNTSNNDFFTSITFTLDNGCATTIFGAYYPLYIYRNGLIKFSSNGDILWQKYYESPDENVQDEELGNLILTPDHGFLLSGFCGYPDPENPSLGWLHPYYLKTDSLGNFEWDLVLHKETGDIGGIAYKSIINQNNTFYYSCIRHFYHSDTLYARRPALVKIDMQGNVVGVYDLVHENYDWGTLFSAVFINDSLLAGSANWGYNEDEPQSRAIIFDTLGNLKDSLTLLNTGWLAQTAKTFDNKLLFYNTIEENGVFSNYLFKLTQDIEQDTFYTTPFIYDSLCPYQIVSDTIVPDDCGVIVGMEEEDKTVGREDGRTGGLEVWPNPGNDKIHIRLPMADGRFPIYYELVIYDIFGRKVEEVAVPTGQEEIQLDISGYPPGIYFTVVRDKTGIIGSAKFLVVN